MAGAVCYHILWLFVFALAPAPMYEGDHAFTNIDNLDLKKYLAEDQVGQRTPAFFRCIESVFVDVCLRGAAYALLETERADEYCGLAHRRGDLL